MQKQKHRSSCEIEIALLRNVLLNGERKTKLMYKCNLSVKEMHSYIPMLQAHRLLNYDNVLHTYNITILGKRILDMYERLMGETEQ